MFASVLLPLAVEGTFTYTVPSALANRVEVGLRVVVQFGAKRYYTGIVTSLSDDLPQPDVKLKPITDLADDVPIVLVAQLSFWQWLSDYYMCTPGEVMKAALPTGLKLESETLLVRNDEFASETAQWSGREADIWQKMESGKPATVTELEKKWNERGLLLPFKHLIDMGAVVVRESLIRSYKPRTETYVRLCAKYFDEQTLNALLDSLHRAPSQEALLLRYLEMSAAATSLTLHNPALLCPVAKQSLCPLPSDISALTSLRLKGVLETYKVAVSRLKCSDEASKMIGIKPLSDEQQHAFSQINEAFEHKNVCLLHGVTSSGKTEVYTHLIRQTIDRGQQVLYLVPEIALTTQLTSRLSRVFGSEMGVYHSKFPDAERVEIWRKQLSNEPFPLILGVRSSLFLPFRNLGLIIVDEEHETSYKQVDPAPRYNARDAAVVLAMKLGAKVLLGSATPSLESYHNVETGKYALVEMLHRFGGVEMPDIEVVDVKELRRKKEMNTPFSPRLTEEIRSALSQNAQAILFQNRRGYSPVLECRTCGWVPRCTKCDVSLTFHQKIGKLVCHFCGATYNVPIQCPCCGDTELRDLGYGTEKIEAAAASIFPEAKTERMDLDTTRSRSAYEDIIARFQKGETNLLIGTQMVTKGLDFDRVQVVGILNADQMLNVPDFRATERSFQMLSQVAGRAGRRGRRGRVILQTRQADNPVIGQIVASDYRAMYRSQIAERKQYVFPPVCRLIEVYLKHRNEDVVAHAALHYAALLRPYFGESVMGPDRPLVSRVQMLHIRKIIVKISPSLSSLGVRRALHSARSNVWQYKVYKGVQIYFNVDP